MHSRADDADEAAQRSSEQSGSADGPLEELSEDLGLSLEELGTAYAALVGAGETKPDEAVSRCVNQSPAAETEPTAADAMPEIGVEVSPRSILEALLFVGHPQNEPLTSKQVASLLRGVKPKEVDAMVAELNAIYQSEGSPYHIASVGAGYRMQLRDEFSGLRDVFYGRVREARLSQPAVDVLAIVAYNQPLTRDEVDKLRGKPSSGLLSQLVRRRLLRIERSNTKPRRPQYFTTDRFLELFGLESTSDLPVSEEEGMPP